MQLKWFKIKERMHYGTLCMVRQILESRQLGYLNEITQNVHGIDKLVLEMQLNSYVFVENILQQFI